RRWVQRLPVSIEKSITKLLTILLSFIFLKNGNNCSFPSPKGSGRSGNRRLDSFANSRSALRPGPAPGRSRHNQADGRQPVQGAGSASAAGGGRPGRDRRISGRQSARRIDGGSAPTLSCPRRA